MVSDGVAGVGITPTSGAPSAVPATKMPAPSVAIPAMRVSGWTNSGCVTALPLLGSSPAKTSRLAPLTTLKSPPT